MIEDVDKTALNQLNTVNEAREVGPSHSTGVFDENFDDEEDQIDQIKQDSFGDQDLVIQNENQPKSVAIDNLNFGASYENTPTTENQNKQRNSHEGAIVKGKVGLLLYNEFGPFRRLSNLPFSVTGRPRPMSIDSHFEPQAPGKYRI